MLFVWLVFGFVGGYLMAEVDLATFDDGSEKVFSNTMKTSV